MLRFITVVLLATGVSARFRGSNAFVVDDVEEYDQDRELATLPSTEAPSTVPYSIPMVEIAPETATASSSTPSEDIVPGDGHDPMEVVEAAIDVLNTPVNQMVGSNPLRRLLRLVGPTKTDFLKSIRLTQEMQKVAEEKSTQTQLPDLPPMVNHIFGFQESDEELFHKTTTFAPLFPIVSYDHDAIYKYLNKLAESTAKSTSAPLPKS